ncbi:MAG TPA: PilZ domain-containing protein [Nitrospiria bacterium]|nr:PilZ domain-containing protein [Nitrospiria bacterium]
MRNVKNRRMQTRYPWQGEVAYRRSVPSRGQTLRTISGQGQLHNVSEGGICLLTDERLAPKQLLSIALPLSQPEVSVPTLAYVQWTRPMRGTGRYAAGLSFVV